MKLTGRHIHEAYQRVRPRRAKRWSKLSRSVKRLYAEMARELNIQLRDDTVGITAVRCPNCHEMLEVAHAEGHACWVAHESYTVRSDWSTLQRELGKE